ncbi:MAG: hypothetical protein ACXW3X_10160 [Rhodoplanes sp.]
MPSNRYQTGAYERATNDFYPTPSWVTELLTNTVRLRGTVWEPCAGKGALATVIAAAGYRVLATDLAAYEDCVFPVASGVDALQASLPPGARTICTNPPYGKILLPQLVRHWLAILNPVGGQLALLLRVLWGESQGGQALTTRHPAYAGKLKTPRRILWYEGTPQHRGGSAQEEHAWFLWDWRRDATRMPFDASACDSRLTGCEVCGAPLDGRRRHAVVCSTSCRVTRHRRRARA